MEWTSYPRPVRLVQYTIKGQYWKLHHHAVQQVQNHSHLWTLHTVIVIDIFGTICQQRDVGHATSFEIRFGFPSL
jgi:hypothetical protein